MAVIIESAGMNAQQPSVYCRQKGRYAKQIARWKASAIAGNERKVKLTQAKNESWPQSGSQPHSQPG
jgi:hypothetical protein